MKRVGVLIGLVLGSVIVAFGQTASVTDRVSKQNALFDEFYGWQLKNFPELATSWGDYRAAAQGERRPPRAVESDPD